MTFECIKDRIKGAEGNITAIHCPGCGCPIRVLMPTDRISSRKIGNEMHHYHKVELVSLPMYREIHLECSFNGLLSKHVTHACAACAAKADLEHWQIIHDHDLERLNDKILIHRTVLRVLDINEGGVP